MSLPRDLGDGIRAIAFVLIAAVLATAPVQSRGQGTTSNEQAAPSGGPIRLRQPAAEPATPTPLVPPPAQQPAQEAPPQPALQPQQPPQPQLQQPMLQQQPVLRPSEFEAFVGLRRFGAELVNELAGGAADYSPIVPADYVIQTGDELQVMLWGSVDADLRLIVDRSGRINIPRVGPVLVAGVRFSDLQPVLVRRVGQVFKNFELSASLGKLRGLRVYVTGFVQRPGAYAVAGLSTVINAVMRAGGPAAAGSYRRIELRREGRPVATFDLYDLLLRGDRGSDWLVQPDDVILVNPVGPQVALRGSVNKPAIFELKPGENLRDVLAMAGGFSPVADTARVAVERLDERNGQRVEQLALPANNQSPLSNGDVIRVFSAVSSSLSVQRQNKRVRIEGEVTSPGEYVLPPQSTLVDAVRAAGGLSPSAFVFGVNFTRESVRATQRENYDRALRDLEVDLARTSSSQRVASSEEVATQTARANASTRLLEQLRALQPTGRVVLQLAMDASELPALAVEDGDRVVVPPKPSTVGVFGSVFNAGSYLHLPSRTLEDYLRLAGGPTKGADEASVFVVRANGQVISRRQNATWFARNSEFGGIRAEPGDTVFVPEEMDKTTFVQIAKDWTQILFQFGVGLAGITNSLR